MTARVALITGGAKGIGRAVALDLGRQGWRVAVAYRSSTGAAAETVAAVERGGGRCLALARDVSDPVVARQLVADVEREWGRVDVLVNGAGPYHRVPLLEESAEGWREMFDHNLHPVFYLAQAVAPGMRTRRWGRIVTFAMANADQALAQPMVTAHYIAKVGVLVLTRTLAKLLAPDGITVNAISPGFIDSGSAPPDELAKMVKSIPAGYVGTVDDAVGAVRYLLSDDARYVNGANLVVSGGWGI
ncbi:MAG: SDR family oxidoreductase [Deltaproteobacteria bacterium]|nr:SDR family oxidoreductase [Deltaproteobacteria bacterium]